MVTNRVARIQGIVALVVTPIMVALIMKMCSAATKRHDYCTDKLSAYYFVLDTVKPSASVFLASQQNFVSRNINAAKSVDAPAVTQVTHSYVGDCTHQFEGYVDIVTHSGNRLRAYYKTAVKHIGSDRWVELQTTEFSANGPVVSRPSKAPLVTPGRVLDASDTVGITREAQEWLRILGYDVGQPDGVAGPKTAAALRQFSQDAKLTNDLERVTPEILEALRRWGPTGTGPRPN